MVDDDDVDVEGDDFLFLAGKIENENLNFHRFVCLAVRSYDVSGLVGWLVGW